MIVSFLSGKHAVTRWCVHSVLHRWPASSLVLVLQVVRECGYDHYQRVLDILLLFQQLHSCAEFPPVESLTACWQKNVCLVSTERGSLLKFTPAVGCAVMHSTQAV